MRREALIHKLKKVQMNVNDLTQTLPCSQDVFKAYQVNYSRELENSDEKLTKIPVPTSNSGTVSNTRSTPNINI